MKIVNKMKVSFPSKSINEGLARMVVTAFAASVDPTVEELCDLKTAVSEAVTNAIVHGYRDTMGEIYITARMTDAGRISVKIQDKGCGIPDIPRAMEPLYTTCQSGERAGLGFAVMGELCDKVRVRSSVGKGTVVTLEKQLSTRE
ncbi:MAG: anti-sigma F factor [Angelakisella sp.]